MLPLLLQETATVPMTTLALVVGALLAAIRLAEAGLKIAADAFKARRNGEPHAHQRSTDTRPIDPNDWPVKRREFAAVRDDLVKDVDRHERDLGVMRELIGENHAEILTAIGEVKVQIAGLKR